MPKKNGYCIFDDDVNEFIDKSEEADGFIFAGPVYYGSINPTLTNFLTRAFYASFCGGKRVFIFLLKNINIVQR